MTVYRWSHPVEDLSAEEEYKFVRRTLLGLNSSFLHQGIYLFKDLIDVSTGEKLPCLYGKITEVYLTKEFHPAVKTLGGSTVVFDEVIAHNYTLERIEIELLNKNTD